MRTAIFVIAALLMASSLAMRTKTEQKVMEKISSMELQSHFGKAIKSLISLSKFEELAEVEEILTEVENEINASRDSLVAEQTKLRADHRDQNRASKESLAAQYTDLQNKEAHRDQLRVDIAAKEKQIQDALDLIAKTQNDIVVENARRAAEHAKNMQIIADIKEAQQACADALVIMDKMKQEDLTQAQQIAPLASSFLQMRTDKVKSHLYKIKQHLTKGSLSSTHVTFAPMMQIFLELADAGVNAELMDQIITKIQELVEHLQQEAEATQAADDEDARSSAALIQRYNDLISKLTEDVATYREELAALNADLEATLAYIENLQNAIAAAESAWLAFRINYESLAAHYKATISRLRLDLDVLSLAIKCLVGEGSGAACDTFPSAQAECVFNAYSENSFAGDVVAAGTGNLVEGTAVASFRINGDCSVNLYAGADFSGDRRSYSAGEDVFVRHVESVRLVPNTPCHLTIFSKFGQGGASETFNGEVADFGTTDVYGYSLAGDHSCRATFYSGANFEGESFNASEGQAGQVSADFAGRVTSAKVWRVQEQA